MLQWLNIEAINTISISIIVRTQVERNARRISLSKSLRSTLFKPRRRQLVLVR